MKKCIVVILNYLLMQLLLSCCVCSSVLYAQDATLRLETTSADDLSFRVFYKGKEVIGESPLGMTIDNQFIGKNVRIKSVIPGRQANEEKCQTYTIERSDGNIYYVDTCEYADGVARKS